MTPDKLKQVREALEAVVSVPRNYEPDAPIRAFGPEFEMAEDALAILDRSEPSYTLEQVHDAVRWSVGEKTTKRIMARLKGTK